MKRTIETAVLREAVLSTELSLAELAARLGWWNGSKPDTVRLSRRLGIALTQDPHGPWRRTRRIQTATAVAIAEAAGLDPCDVGV